MVFEELRIDLYVRCLARQFEPREYFDSMRNDEMSKKFPEILALKVPDKHDGTTYDHVMKLLARGRNPFQRFGLLVHDLGKGLTDPALHPAHHGHDKLGVPAVEAFCDRLMFPEDWKRFGVACCREHMRIKLMHEMAPSKIIRLVDENAEFVFELLDVSFIDSAYREGAMLHEEIDKHEWRKRVVAYAIGAIAATRENPATPVSADQLLQVRTMTLKHLIKNIGTKRVYEL